MWTTSDKIPEGAGTIEDLIVRARQKFNDVETQAKYIKIGVDLIKRDHEDLVRIFNFVYSGYEGVLTIFPSGRDICALWELYDSGALEASGVEKYSLNTEHFQVIFSTSPDFREPILPRIMNKKNRLSYGQICKRI